MKTAASIVLALVASYLTLVWAVGHLDAVSNAACSDEFSLPGIVCRFGGLGITLLLVPVSGLAAFLIARLAMAK